MSDRLARILLVDDEQSIQTLLSYPLRRDGYEVVQATDGRQALDRFDEQAFDLVVLDLMLPKIDGLEVCRRLRNRSSVPIIMLTAKSEEIDKVVGLELGADDYIAKPFQLREVLARVRAVLRRYGPVDAAQPALVAAHETYRFDTMVLDVTQREFFRDGAPHELTTTEFNLLAIFVRRPHRVLTRDNLMDLLKGHEWSPLDRSIDALIGRLRKKIEHSAEHPRLIKTVRGVGYAFTADVTRQ
jgi:DNA-binding response OmpR family regulator